MGAGPECLPEFWPPQCWLSQESGRVFALGSVQPHFWGCSALESGSTLGKSMADDTRAPQPTRMKSALRTRCSSGSTEKGRSLIVVRAESPETAKVLAEF